MEQEQPFISTYLRVTSGNLLRSVGVKLSDADVEAQLLAKDSFYRHILKLPAAQILADINFAQFEDAHGYLQKRLTDLIFANYALTAEGADATMTLQEGAQQKLNMLQEEFEQETTDMQELKEQNDVLQNQVYNAMVTSLAEWHDTCNQQAQIIADQLSANGYNLQPDFAKRLSRRLRKSLCGEANLDETLKRLQLDKESTDMVTKAVAVTLMEDLA